MQSFIYAMVGVPLVILLAAIPLLAWGICKRRYAITAMGVLLLGGSVCLALYGGGVAWLASARYLTPDAWLLYEAKSSDSRVAQGAIGDLLPRWREGTMSDEHAMALLDRLMATRSNELDALAMITKMHTAGKAPDETWIRFWRDRSTVELKFRSLAHRNEPIPVRLICSSRLKSEDTACQGTLVSLSVGGINCAPVPEIHDWGSPYGQPSRDKTLLLPASVTDRLQDGPQAVSAVVEVTLSNDHDQIRFRMDAKAHFDLLPLAQPAIRLIANNADRDAMRDSLSMHLEESPPMPLNEGIYPEPLEAEANLRTWTYRGASGDKPIAVGILCHDPPVSALFQVAYRHQGQQRIFGFVQCEAHHDFRSPYRWIVPSIAPDGGEWVFHSYPLYGLQTADIEECWGEDMVIPVVLPEASNGG